MFATGGRGGRGGGSSGNREDGSVCCGKSYRTGSKATSGGGPISAGGGRGSGGFGAIYGGLKARGGRWKMHPDAPREPARHSAAAVLFKTLSGTTEPDTRAGPVPVSARQTLGRA